MVAVEEITRQVLRNCSISDAKYAGNYSVCGLAMRLRDLYKWEKGLEPWIEEQPPVLLEWIGRKEEEWEGLMESDLGEITIDGSPYPPFDVEKINERLEPLGFCYGAGFVHGLKPTFFFAPIEEKRRMNGTTIFLLGRELARDLLTLPAMTQDNSILIRWESVRLFLWNQIFFVKKSGREPLRSALKIYGANDQDPVSLQQNLNRICRDELETYIHHELGEIRENAFDRKMWREIVSQLPHTPVEILVRALKDILADTGEHGCLSHIIRERKISSLCFYTAFLDGLKKELFHDLPKAFERFEKSGEWPLIEQASVSAFRRAKKHAEAVIRLFVEGREKNDLQWAGKEIEREILKPLGPGRER
ncbi:MAG: hypothetical protein C4576_24925 [Desulfobacteraceae bacterium]|nr:MAG: hypothetical protein C4576_24925 [Desulfobacteraceae bacterium]